MCELLRKYEEVSGGFVDIYKILNERNEHSEISNQLITCSMDIGKNIRQLEKEEKYEALLSARSTVLKEIETGELLIEMFVKSGLVAEEKAAAVLKDCMILSDLIKSKYSFLVQTIGGRIL